MTRGERGTWDATVPGDLLGHSYLYRLTFPDGTVNVSPDPYARASTANSERSVVLDPAAILPTPTGEAPDPTQPSAPPTTRMPAFGPASDAVIYEAHVRDLTIGPDNGITHKGKFLGLTESGTATRLGNPSGLDHLTQLGATHVQLLPIFDFGSVDETGDLSFGAQYNWGYDPVNYNVPEGSYASDPSDPASRIADLKALVGALHRRGLRVIMDVVYNHVYDAARSPLELTVPGYYFRMRPDGTYFDGTACGNETASEQPMMRKYIVDSVRYWASEFKLDGFRFDLMGVHDVPTMRAVREALDEIDPSILVIGEGWVMGNHGNDVVPADYDHARELPRIGFFNDSFRDAMKGSVFEAGEPGFVSGANDPALTEAVWDSIKGGRGRYGFVDAGQSVVYNEAHDNWTMRDKLSATETLAGASEKELARRHMMATAIQLTSQGIAFVHAGQEFLRTKDGDENSFRSPDSVNALDYDRAAEFGAEKRFVTDLIRFRRENDWLRLRDFDEIEERYELLALDGERLGYRVRDAFGPSGHAWVFANASRDEWRATLPAGEYEVLVIDVGVLAEPERLVSEGCVNVSALAFVMLRNA